MAFALIKRTLIFFVLILCMLSCCQAWKPYVEEFDMLLRVSVHSRVLIYDGVVDAPYASNIRRPDSIGALST